MRYSIEGEPLPVVICNLEQGRGNDYREWCHVVDVPEHEKWRQLVAASARCLEERFRGKHFLKPLHGNEREWDDRVCIVVPGSIRAFDIVPGQDLIVQKSAFLAAVSSVDLSVFFQQRIGSGLFGGEDLLCRSFPEVEPHFWNLMVILKNMNLHPDSRLLWTRDTLQP